MQIVALTVLAFTFAATASAQGRVVKDPNPKPVLVAPDLTISGISWRNKPSLAVIIVENIGKVKSGATNGGYTCKSGPTKEGYFITTGAQFYIPELSPNQRKRFTLDCKSSVLLQAGLDGEKKVAEANENNNEFSFAEVP